MQRTALGETVAPPDVDTLRDDICPVCGSTDSYNGDKCLVCGFEKPPSMFMDPDTELASQVDLRQQDQENQVNPPPTTPDGDTNGPVAPDLQCNVCGAEFNSTQELEDSGDPYFAAPGQSAPAVDDLLDPNAENEEANPNSGGSIPDKDGDTGTKDSDISTLPGSASGDNANENVDDPKDTQDTPGGEDDQDSNDDSTDDSENSSDDDDEQGARKSGAKQDQDDDASDQDDNDNSGEGGLGEEDTSENSTDSAAGGISMDDGPERVDPTNSDKPEGADGDPDGMQGDPSENPQDPANVNPEEQYEQQYAEDQDAESKTGYEAGDVCPNCGEGILEPIGSTPVADETDNPNNEQMPPPQGDADPSDDPVASKEIPKTSGRMSYESTQRLSKAEGDFSMPEKNPAAARRQALFTALNQNAKMLRRQAAAGVQERLLRQAIEARTATLEAQIFRLAELVGAESDRVLASLNEKGFQTHASLVHKAALIRTADERDPAQPIPEPPAGAPVVTEQEAAQPAARADVTQMGASPITDVSADATIAVDQPYGEVAFEPLNLNQVDVTQPIEGTQGHLPPEQTIVPVEVRVGDPDKATPSFPITWGGEGPIVGGSVGTGGPDVQRAPDSPPAVMPGTTASRDRTYSSLRLARLRIQAGIAPADADDLVISAAIDGNSDMTNDIINREIATLQGVVASRQAPRTASRSLVPRPMTDREPASFAGTGPIQSHGSLTAVSDDEFWDA